MNILFGHDVQNDGSNIEGQALPVESRADHGVEWSLEVKKYGRTRWEDSTYMPVRRQVSCQPNGCP